MQSMKNHFRYIPKYSLLLLAGLFLLVVSASAQDYTDYYDPLGELQSLDRMLIQYADSNNVEAVLHCLTNGANPNAARLDGITALMYAVQNDNYVMVSLLLNNGASAQAVPDDGNTALHAAAIMGLDSIAVLLLNANADVDACNYKGFTPLHYSVWHGYPYLSELLLLHGASVNSVDNEGNTPLMLAAYNGAFLCAQTLLAHGANPNKADINGITPAMAVAELNDTAMLGLLLRGGAIASQTDARGFDALAHAIRRGAKHTVAQLMAEGQFNSDMPQSYRQLARSSNSSDIRNAVDVRLPQNKAKFGIGAVLVGVDMWAGKRAWHLGFHAGIMEQKFGVELLVRYMRRASSPVLLENDRRLYQVDERRRLLGLCVSQHRCMYAVDADRFLGIHYGLGFDFVFRRFDIVGKPSNRPYMNAMAGVFWRSWNHEWQLGWNYTGLKTIDISPHTFSLGFMWLIPMQQSPRIKRIYVR